MKKLNITIAMPVLAAILVVAGGCSKFLPEERESMGTNSVFSQTVFEPVLGRSTVYSGIFSNTNSSTSYPASFKIVNPRRFNGDPAPELTDVLPVSAWKSIYTGTESSIEEIEAKRTLEYHPVWEMRESSGDLVMWSSARSSFIRSQPDSGYIFDVEVSNSGGRRFFRDMRLRPLRERPYDPSNFNAITGQATQPGIAPASMVFIKGAKTNEYLNSSNVDVFIRKKTEKSASGNTLTFMFLDTLYKPMDPAVFNLTDWENLVHGFNMVKTDSSVVYDVAYPIPLAETPTRYTTSDGRSARVAFSYDRLGFGNMREVGSFTLNFSIFEPGDWEIVFAFKYDNPKFTND